MVNDSGNGIYGQNAIRALSRANPQLQNESSMLNRSIQAQNANLLSNLQSAPYNDYEYGKAKNAYNLNNYMPNSAGTEHLPNIMGAQKQQLNLQLSNSKSNLNTMGYPQIESGQNQGRTMTAENYMRPKNARNAGMPEIVAQGSVGATAPGNVQAQGANMVGNNAYPGVQASHLGVYPHVQNADGSNGGFP